jgi:hypothetical protein
MAILVMIQYQSGLFSFARRAISGAAVSFLILSFLFAFIYTEVVTLAKAEVHLEGCLERIHAHAGMTAMV